jgi:hypothetical protein
MKIKIGSILDQMSPGVRKAAEEEARQRGQTLEQFVENQLTIQLTDDEMSLNAARIRANSWGADASGPPPTVSAGIRGRFGR